MWWRRFRLAWRSEAEEGDQVARLWCDSPPLPLGPSHSLPTTCLPPSLPLSLPTGRQTATPCVGDAHVPQNYPTSFLLPCRPMFWSIYNKYLFSSPVCIPITPLSGPVTVIRPSTLKIINNTSSVSILGHNNCLESVVGF